MCEPLVTCKFCHSEAWFYCARNLLPPARSRVLTGKRHGVGMADWRLSKCLAI